MAKTENAKLLITADETNADVALDQILGGYYDSYRLCNPTALAVGGSEASNRVEHYESAKTAVTYYMAFENGQLDHVNIFKNPIFPPTVVIKIDTTAPTLNLTETEIAEIRATLDLKGADEPSDAMKAAIKTAIKNASRSFEIKGHVIADDSGTAAIEFDEFCELLDDAKDTAGCHLSTSKYEGGYAVEEKFGYSGYDIAVEFEGTVSYNIYIALTSFETKADLIIEIDSEELTSDDFDDTDEIEPADELALETETATTPTPSTKKLGRWNVPAGIAEAVEEGKTVIWLQKSSGKILPRINGHAAKPENVAALLHNLGYSSLRKPNVFFLGNEKFGAVAGENLCVDTEILTGLLDTDGRGGLYFEYLSRVGTWFNGDTTNRMEIRHSWSGKPDYYFTAAATTEPEPDAPAETETATTTLEGVTSDEISARISEERRELRKIRTRLAGIDAELNQLNAEFADALNDAERVDIASMISKRLKERGRLLKKTNKTTATLNALVKATSTDTSPSAFDIQAATNVPSTAPAELVKAESKTLKRLRNNLNKINAEISNIEAVAYLEGTPTALTLGFLTEKTNRRNRLIKKIRNAEINLAAFEKIAA